MNRNAKAYVIWDWNGTILDDTALCIECINTVLASQDLPPLPDREAYRNIFTFPVRGYYEKLGFDFTRRSFEDLAGDFMALYQKRSLSCRLAEGIRPVLKTVKQEGWGQIVLSASRQDNLLEQAACLGLAGDDFFDEILGTGDIYASSKIEAGRKWRNSLDSEVRLIFIGDTFHDYETAQVLGADCLLYTGGHQTLPVPANGEYRLIDKFNEIPAFLHGCNVR